METRCSLPILGMLINTRGVRALINLKGKTKTGERAGEHWRDVGWGWDDCKHQSLMQSYGGGTVPHEGQRVLHRLIPKLTMRSLRRWTAPSSMGAEMKQNSTYLFQKQTQKENSTQLNRDESQIRCTCKTLPCLSLRVSFKPIAWKQKKNPFAK